MNIEIIEQCIARLRALDGEIRSAEEELLKRRAKVDDLKREQAELKEKLAKELRGVLGETVIARRRPLAQRSKGSLAASVLEILSEAQIADVRKIRGEIQARGLNPGSLPATLNRMVRDGALVRVSRGVYGRAKRDQAAPQEDVLGMQREAEGQTS